MRENRLKIIITIITVILAGVLASFIIISNNQEKKQAERIQQLQNQARPYEQQISEINGNLQKKKKNIESINNAIISLCFQVKAVEDIDWAETEFASFHYPMTMVLDLSNDFEVNNGIIERISVSKINTDLIFSGTTVLSNAPSVLLKLQSVSQDKEIPMPALFFFDEGEHTNENTELILANGFNGFTQLSDYSANIVTGTMESGLFYTEHVPVKAGDNKIESSIELAVMENKPIILSFNVGSIIETDNYQSFIDTTINAIQKYEDQANIENISGLFEQQSTQKLGAEEKQDEYDKYEAEQKVRIEELQEKINSIYKDWKLK